MKQKISFWAQIVTICLCIAAIAFGVYSAANASVTASGKIGFTAHNSKITAGGYIYGHALGNVDYGLPATIDQKDTFTSITVDGTATSVAGTLDIGDRYFSDMASNDGTPAPIVIVIEVTNQSGFDITVSTNLNDVDMPDGIPISITLKNAATAASQTIADKAKATFEYTLTLNPTASSGTTVVAGKYNTFALTAFSIPLTSVKYVTNVEPSDPEPTPDPEPAEGYTLKTYGSFFGNDPINFLYSIDGGDFELFYSFELEYVGVKTIRICSLCYYDRFCFGLDINLYIYIGTQASGEPFAVLNDGDYEGIVEITLTSDMYLYFYLEN